MGLVKFDASHCKRNYMCSYSSYYKSFKILGNCQDHNNRLKLSKNLFPPGKIRFCKKSDFGQKTLRIVLLEVTGSLMIEKMATEYQRLHNWSTDGSSE